MQKVLYDTTHVRVVKRGPLARTIHLDGKRRGCIKVSDPASCVAVLKLLGVKRA